MAVQHRRVTTWLACGLLAASILPWFVSSNVVKLIAEQDHVLLGRYSLEWFSALFVLTPTLWLAAYVVWALGTHSPKAVLFRVVALLLGMSVAALVVDIAARIRREPRYVERQVVTRTRWPGERVEDIVRHRPPHQQYRIRYTDAPYTARSYPWAPPGYPAVDITLTTDHRGYRNLTRLDRYDIVTLGDSFTEGSRVSDEEAWPVLVGRKLGRTVYNLGISGVDPDYYLSTLRAFALEVKPRTVLIMVYEGNDFKGVPLEEPSTAWSGRRIQEMITAFPARVGRWLETSIKYSPIVLSLRSAFLQYLGPINANGPVPGAEVLSWMPVAVPTGPDAKHYSFEPKRLVRLYWTKAAFRQSPGWTSTAEVFRRIKAVCAREGHRLVFVYAPSKPHVVMPLARDRVTAEELHAFAAFRERHLPPPEDFTRELFARLDTQETVLREFFAEEGIEFVSATAILRQWASQGRQVYYTYDQHWTALGHEAVAEAVSRYFTAGRMPARH
jgi:hypothetical protein